MGRRLIKLTTVLFLLSLQPLVLRAQTEVDTLSTSCNFEVSYTIQHPSCPQEADGSIDLVLVNRVGNDSIYWIGGTSDSTAYVSFLTAGVYEARVGDDTQCFDTVTFTLNDPSPVLFDLAATKSCPGINNGSITVMPTSGTADAYSIDGGTTQNEPVFSDLEPGIHTISVFDASGCYYDTDIEVTESEIPTIIFSQEEPSCAGTGDASFIVIIETVSNSESYEYSLDGNNYFPDSTFENLNDGVYDVFIRNENLCVFTETITITNPEEPTITIEKTDATCPEAEDASFIVIIETVSNSDNFEYSIDGVNYQPDSIFENLESDFYQVFIKNDSNCIFEESVFIEEPNVPTIDFEINEVTCPGETDASFIVIIETVSNTEDYEYSIDGDNYIPDSIFSNLPAGAYTLYARDESDCIHSQLVNIDEPETPIIDFEINDVQCPDGEDGSFIVIIETVSNTEDYEYSIDGVNYQPDSLFSDLEAGVYEVRAQNSLGCEFTQLMEVGEPETPTFDFDINNVTCPDGNDASFIVIIETVSNTEEYLYSIDGNNFQPDSTFSNLEAGVYEVYVQSTNGCSFMQLTEVEEPEPPTIDFEINDVLCPDGEDGSFIVIIETVSNTEEYEYSIDGGVYQGDSTFTDLVAGIYEVHVQSNLGCEFTQLMEVDEPEMPTIDFEINNVTCPGGNDASLIVIIETVSNSENYEFSIDGNEFQEDSIFQNIAAGLHDIVIKNEQFCLFSEIINIEEPDTPTIEFDIDHVTCSGGNDASFIVIIETVSNTENYEYSIDGGVYQDDSTFTNFEAGLFEVSIRDENGCISSDFILIEEPDELELSLTASDVSCPGDNNGTITAMATGPGNVFEYSLDGVNFQSSNIFENLGPDVYEITVRNESTCFVSDISVINEPALPDFNVDIQNISCNGGLDGSITINLISGIEPFEFALDDSIYQSSNVFENLAAGAYTLYLMDDSGCVFTSTASINEPPPLNAYTNSQNETCDYDNGWIALTIDGGTAPYTYEWGGDGSGSTPSISSLSEGTYHVSITDGNTCLLTDIIVIENEPAPTIEAQLHSLKCFEDQDGWISLNIESQSAPFNFIWSNGENTDQVNDLSAGDYSVTVSDRNNCFSAAHFTLEEPDELQVDGETLTTDFSGQINLFVEGGQSPYNYQWSNGHTTENLDNVPFGFYTVTVTDANGCESSADFRVLDPDLAIDGAINVYPTLTTNEVNIDIQLPEAKKVNIYMVDELGRIVQVIDPSTIEQQVYTLDMEQLAAAVYFLRIEVGADFVVKKVVKVLE